MQSLVVSSNFKELTDDEMFDVNGGVIKLLGIGTVTGAIIGGVHAAVRGDCWITGAAKGAVKSTVLAVSKVMAIGLPVYKAVNAGYWSFKAFKATDAMLGR